MLADLFALRSERDIGSLRYLFVGPEGVGKKGFAVELAKTLERGTIDYLSRSLIARSRAESSAVTARPSLSTWVEAPVP